MSLVRSLLKFKLVPSLLGSIVSPSNDIYWETEMSFYWNTVMTSRWNTTMDSEAM